jgi:hypothetical protein
MKEEDKGEIPAKVYWHKMSDKVTYLCKEYLQRFCVFILGRLCFLACFKNNFKKFFLKIIVLTLEYDLVLVRWFQFQTLPFF